MANVQELFTSFAPDVNEDFKPFIEVIQQIMEIPEESLTPEVVNSLKELVDSGFSEEQKKATISIVVQSFENAKLSISQVKSSVEQGKATLNSIIDELHPSKYKRELIENVFGIFYEIFDGVILQYHNIELPIKLDESARIPTYAHDTDACADIYASQDFTVPAHSLSNKIPTGLHVALPEGWVMMIAPRSSIGFKSGLRLSNSIGIIDEEYRGEIGVLYDNFSDSDYEIKAGDRIAQCWVQPVYRFNGVPVDTLPESNRGEGGFGSTGK